MVFQCLTLRQDKTQKEHGRYYIIEIAAENESLQLPGVLVSNSTI